MVNAGRAARIGRCLEWLPAFASGVVADDQIAGHQINLLPMIVDERARGEDAGRESQQARPAAHLACLVEIAGQDFLLDAGGIAGRHRPAFTHVDFMEFETRLVHGHIFLNFLPQARSCVQTNDAIRPVAMARCALYIVRPPG